MSAIAHMGRTRPSTGEKGQQWCQWICSERSSLMPTYFTFPKSKKITWILYLIKVSTKKSATVFGGGKLCVQDLLHLVAMWLNWVASQLVPFRQCGTNSVLRWNKPIYPSSQHQDAGVPLVLSLASAKDPAANVLPTPDLSFSVSPWPKAQSFTGLCAQTHELPRHWGKILGHTQDDAHIISPSKFWFTTKFQGHLTTDS